MKNHRAVVILAAGASSRMGRPKQLLLYKGQAFLQRVIEAARNAEVQHVLTVLGANATLIMEELDMKDAQVVVNGNWQEGVASSIRKGVEQVLTQWPAIQEIAFVVGDQPYLSTEVINELFALRMQTGKPIAACLYGGVVGTPAVFYHTFFNELSGLKGEEGAKKIIKTNKAQVAFLDFPGGITDVDTDTDYQDLLRREEVGNGNT